MSSFAAEVVEKNSGSRKLKFTRTCSMLSQYLKQNGSFGGFSREMTCNNSRQDDQKEKTPITMNLLPTDDHFTAKAVPEVQPMDLFPHDTGGFVRSLSMKEPAAVETVPAEVVEKGTQVGTPMTIFYGGQVLIFDKLPKDKAKEIMDYADVISNNTPPAGDNDQLIVNSSCVVDLNSPLLASNVPAAVSDGIGSPVEADLGSDGEKMAKQNHVPIARKASLHRFLEKRKDRIIAKAPYQIVNNGGSTEVSTKPPPAEEKKSWLNLASLMPPPPPRLQLQL
ncbi:hypothetical protein MKX01_002439 [Papaver californicum]|nr:hypothetical protein MKX01_002439 [Papaver californicum]